MEVPVEVTFIETPQCPCHTGLYLLHGYEMVSLEDTLQSREQQEVARSEIRRIRRVIESCYLFLGQKPSHTEGGVRRRVVVMNEPRSV